MDNNKAFSLMGFSVIQASMYSLLIRDGISGSELKTRVFQISNAKSCAAGGLRLALNNVVRVGPNTNSSDPQVLCDAFRALLAAIALDDGHLRTLVYVLSFFIHSGDIIGQLYFTLIFYFFVFKISKFITSHQSAFCN